MAAARIHKTTALVAMGFVLAAACLGGVALTKRGPDPLFLPEMAALPVTLTDGRKIYAQRYELSVFEWNRCAEARACNITLRVRPDQDAATTPATGLSYVDVQQYLIWINDLTGQEFRLPSADEWQQMAASVLPQAPEPLFTDPALAWASSYLTEGLSPRGLRPAGSFSTSPEGISDLDGSVWEWTMQCYDGGTGDAADRCPAYFVGGEHLAAMSYLVRDPARGGCAVGNPPAHLGMRMVSDRPV